MRSLVLITFWSLFAWSSSNAAEIYSCETKEHLLLNGDGLVRAVKMVESPKFMIDKNIGNAVGEIFHGSPKWQIVQRGSVAYSLVTQGTVVNVMGQVPMYKVIVYSFDEQKEKPFVIEGHENVGFFEIFSGTCK
jgi:hypothetical protein